MCHKYDNLIGALPPAFTNVNCAYMSNKLDKAGYLLYLRRTTVLFKIIVRGVQVMYEDSRMQRSS